MNNLFNQKILEKKADGVLGFFDKDGKKDIRAVIELKGAKVPLDQRQKRVGDTRTPVEQAERVRSCIEKLLKENRKLIQVKK